jgi:hypothetical protein
MESFPKDDLVREREGERERERGSGREGAGGREGGRRISSLITASTQMHTKDTNTRIIT